MATVRWLISFRIRLITCFIFWNFSTKGGWRWGLDLDGILPSIFLPIPLGEPSKKKNTKFWTFIEKRYGHVLRGRGGQRAMSKVVFCKKVCFLTPEELLCVKISTFYMLQNMNFNITYLPKPYLKNFTSWFIRNWFQNFKLFLSKCPNYGRGRGVKEPCPK